jgi:hypothetical protein
MWGKSLSANHDPPVGASLLAMDVNDDMCCLEKRVAFKFIVGTPPGASSLLQWSVFRPTKKATRRSPFSFSQR